MQSRKKIVIDNPLIQHKKATKLTVVLSRMANMRGLLKVSIDSGDRN